MPSPTIPSAASSSWCMLVVAIGGALALFAWRAPQLEGGADIRARQPRNALAAQQCLPGRGLRHGLHRHALSAVARCAQRHQDFRRPALFRHHLRADLRGAADPGAVRPASGLAQGRSEGGAAHAGARARPRRRRGCIAVLAIASAAFAGGGRCLRTRRLGDRRQRDRSVRRAQFRARCRYRPRPPRWPMPGSASRCSASPAPRCGAARR